MFSVTHRHHTWLCRSHLQDLPALLGPAARAIKEWEADVEEQQRPEFEARFIRLWDAGDEAAALQVGA